MANNAFYIMSGGMDSTLAAYESKHKYYRNTAIFIDWGQKAVKEEQEAVENICQELDISGPEIIRIPIEQWDKSELTQGEKTKIVQDNNIMVPERNLAFLAIAGSFARANGGGDLIVGFNKADCGYDAKGDFVEAVNKILHHENKELEDADITYIRNSELNLVAPLLDKDKKYIFDKLKENGLLELTYSCYAANGHCKKCPACKRRFALEDT